MEANLVAAYKALKAVQSDANVGQLAPSAEEAKKIIGAMMAQIKSALVVMARKGAEAEVEAILAAP